MTASQSVRPLPASTLPPPSAPRQAWLPSTLAALLLLLAELVRFLHLIRLPTDRLVGHIPDDAFYYLILGQNFAHLHRWTFDGTAPATGFHLLWGYGIAAVYALLPTIGFRAVFTLLFWTSALLVAAALFLLCRLVQLRFNPFAVLGPVAIFFGPFALGVPDWLMEAPLVLLCAAAVTALIGSPRRPTPRRLVAAALLGALGMLSRSDFGLLPLLLLATTLALRTPSWRLATAALLGSLLGLGTVLAHTVLVSGHLVQGSALIKRHWSAAEHDNIRYSIMHNVLPLHADPNAPSVSQRPTHDLERLLALAAAALACAFFVRPRSRDTLALTLALALVPLGYIALYTFDSAALQAWYFGNLLIPLGFLAGAICSPRLAVWRGLTLVATIAWAGNGLVRSLAPIWGAQAGLYTAALYLGQHPELQPVAAWNSGILSYFSGTPVINIDGLVNDTIAPFILTDRLPHYLAERHVHALLDDSNMLTPRLQQRGGYSGTSLTGCITTQTPIPSPQFALGTGNHMVLSLLDPTCLASR